MAKIFFFSILEKKSDEESEEALRQLCWLLSELHSEFFLCCCYVVVDPFSEPGDLLNPISVSRFDALLNRKELASVDEKGSPLLNILPLSS